MLDTQVGKDLLAARAALCCIELGPRFEDGEHVVLDRQPTEHRGLLWQIADAGFRAPMNGGVGEIATVDFDPAGVGGHQAHNHVERSRLAGAVRPQQTNDFAGLHLE